MSSDIDATCISLDDKLDYHAYKNSVLCPSVQGPSALPHRSSGACNDRSMDSLRLHVALIILYLFFTCPRSAITCIQGVFAARHSVPAAATETLPSGDVVLALRETEKRL